MTENESKKSKKIGDFMLVSKGAINDAVQKQIDSFAQGKDVKKIGEILLELGIITKDDLDNSLRRQRVERLKSCPVFASLTDSELSALSKLFTEISVPPGEQFIMQGEEDPTLFIIASGQVEVFRIDNAGNEIPIANVGKGEPIGEMGYFSGGVRTACVRTVKPTELLRADYKHLTHYFENVPRVAMEFTKMVDHRRQELERITQSS